MKDQKNDLVQFYFSILINAKKISTDFQENQMTSMQNHQDLELSNRVNIDGSYSAEKYNAQKIQECPKQIQFESTTSEDLRTETKIKRVPKYSQNLGNKVAKSFTCAFEGCDKRFDFKWILDRHINSHFCFKMHKCDYAGCDKAYKSRENLNLHIKNKHLGVKPYQCKYCISRFSHRNGN